MPNTDLHPTDIPVEQLLKAEVMSGEVLAQIALGHERFCYGIHHHDDGQIEEEWGNWRDVAKQLATDLSSAATRLRAMGAAGEQLQNTAHARMAEHAASRARAIQLKSALENWGRHFTWCAVWKEIPGAPPMPCDCGLARELDTATAHLQMGAAVGEQKTEINSGVCVCGHDETDHGSTQCWFGGPFAATPCHCIHYRPAPSVPHPQHPPHGARSAETTEQKAMNSERLALTDDVRFILGHPNFACISYANALRVLGREISRKAEDEQATVIHWMLTHYLEHGDAWRGACEADLRRAYTKTDADTAAIAPTPDAARPHE
jgi:hypothetical protein